MQQTLHTDANEEIILAPATKLTPKEIVVHFWKFLKSPCLVAEVTARKQDILYPFALLLALNLIASVLVGFVIYNLLELFGLSLFEGHALDKLLKEVPFAVVLFLVAVFAPVVEECFFRMPLRYTRFSGIVLLLGAMLFGVSPLLGAMGTGAVVNMCVAATTLVFIVVYLLWDKLNQWFERLWEQHFGIVFYGMAALFAGIHLANFEQLHLTFALVPLLVLPQFVGALFWGYFRVQYGLKWGMLAHGLYNAVLISVAYYTN